MTSSTRRVAELVASMTLDEKALLTAGEDLWSTFAIERVGIPKVRVTDGPNGARGASVPGSAGQTAACVPCGSALGATWDVDLIERVGEMLGDEARSKACRVLLAPTVNIHRSPLAGRNFECYSEDPLLSGRIAAAFIRGVQSRDVATTVKHFVGNEAEFERTTISSQIDERTLREIYLLPFELAVREGGTLGLMTSYNRLNGDYCTDHVDLLAGILREEWGFDGFVLTDWFAATDTVRSSTAGTDLEMPGPRRALGERVARAVRDGLLDERLVDAQARRLLHVFDRLGALDDPADVVERSEDRPEHRALAREAATSAMVLLRNDGILPIDFTSVRRVAVIGPNAARAQIMGGGSASLSVHYRIAPLDALRARLGEDVEVVYERGCDTDRTVPPLGGNAIVRSDGTPGLDVAFYADPGYGGEVVHRGRLATSRVLLLGAAHENVPAENFSLRATGTFTPEETGTHTFTLVQVGGARLLIDDEVVIDGVAEPPGRGSDFFGFGSEEVERDVELAAGTPVRVTIEYSSQGSAIVHGVKVGCRVPSPPDLLDRAVEAAAAADLALGDRRHERRLGIRRPRSHVAGSARRTGRARRASARRQSAHGRRAEHGRACRARVGPLRLPRCCRCGSAVRRWRTRSSMSWPAMPNRVGGCRPRFLTAWRTTRRTATSRASSARCATARACSSDTAGTTRVGWPRSTPSGSASPTRSSTTER